VLVFGSNFVRAGCGGLVRLCGWSAGDPPVGLGFSAWFKVGFRCDRLVVLLVGCGVGELN
jgi:hypothetical protein